MNCPECKTEVTVSAKFCPECGTKISQRCTCGAQLTGNEKFCPECGNPTASAVKSGSSGGNSAQSYSGPAGNANYSGLDGGGRETVAAPGYTPVRIEVSVGETLDGRYQVKQKLGQGGFGGVYKVFDTLTDEFLAVKVMPFYNRDSIKNVLLEYKSRDKVKNFDHVIKAYQPSQAEYRGQDIILYPMELAEKSMREWLSETKHETEERLEEGLEIFKQACRGVEAIHEAGIIHLDLKPENILLTENKKAKTLEEKWTVKISDFGLARGLGMENLEMLQDGVGTPAYMAPEQILAARWKDVGKEADIYALGMILYELIDGDLPYSGTPKQIKEKKTNPQIEIAPIESQKEIAQVAMECLTREKKRRLDSVSAILLRIDEKRREEDEKRKKTERAKEYLEEGKELASQGRYEEALSKLKQAEELDKENREITKWKEAAEKEIVKKKAEEDKKRREAEAKRRKEEEDRKKKEAAERKRREEAERKQREAEELKRREEEERRRKVPVIEMIDCGNFSIGKYPVTFAQYDAYCDATGKKKPDDEGWDRGNRPVIHVNWYEAKEFCEWMNKMTGQNYRLPEENEWEYAAKGGRYSKGYKYSGSNNLDEVGWYEKNSHGKTQPVGLKKPNELGIYDMSGNVWEWTGPLVLRGGSWGSIGSNCAVSSCRDDGPGARNSVLGFRLFRN